MSGSGALTSFRAAIQEVRDLESLSPRGLAAGRKAAFSRAIGRAAIVLLASHFERYFYAINEEATAFLNETAPRGVTLPEQLRLLHSRYPVEDIEVIDWEHRAGHLAQFVRSDGWLWMEGVSGSIEHWRLLAWMKSPKPASLVRYYRYWGVQDVFTAISRSESTRSALWLGVQGLVDKRNNIAHGDSSEHATGPDVRRYARCATDVCSRADKLLGRRLARLLGTPKPW